MGAWSAAAFDNDSALDWLGDLLPSSRGIDWAAEYRTVLDEFAAFEQRRQSGTNREVRTAEEAEYLIGLFDPPDPEYAAIIRKTIGEEYEDNGDDETFTLVAAAAVLLATVSGDLSGVPDEFHVPDLQGATAALRLRGELAGALRQVLLNKPLLKDCGAKWKKGVVAMADQLDSLESAGQMR